MTFEISKIRHPKEKFYGSLMLLIGSLIWFLLAAALLIAASKNIGMALIFVFYIGILWFVSFVARALLRAYMIGHYVMVSQQQFPQLQKMVEDGARQLGMEAPTAFVYNSSGVMNAMALTLVGRTKYIWLTSQLIDADNDEQVRFVIGHELGHHAAGHLNTIPMLLHLPAHIVPFLGAAYSRARELTCDRVGLVVANNIQASRTALQMLACGSARLNAQLNTAAFEAQERMVPSVAGFFLHIFSHYPRLTRRVEALGQWAQGTGTVSASQTGPSSRRVEPTLA
ncbi:MULTISPECIES: M48 family metallopeptidase [unclassified Rhizobium]|uniref:M48 family metallopeptidase n=1 Tax=unclassified Rhizobium TaxID=2613769 RepID=UPI001AD969E5|nr:MULTISPECIES: M48 family metallopeptidase [unclassified Rhizobium]MBO9098144.1 M48 family metallopeptidase [Rhizobium sp. L58/93]MBO9133074.1 M48 family metallopeptidase [Rhizobium sp. B209b/85]MBO9168294.1 M48 family metallopeptidase [Rhizobium sp. L245/93]MBO9184340.1 M48 family metallopeptidase [Rhizobium sp. E27B/91]QXZ84534.1 M48 family metallopeptidase [Rhizobium sp. K1/93]